MIGKAVCLLSGGIDSTTVLAIALSKGYDCTAISFDYGQRHSRELEASARVADHFHVKRHVVRMNLNEVTSSALTGQKDVETRALDHIEASIPNTYVPSRNIIFLSIAASMAESIGANNIFIGANAVDFSGYPDCRPAFYNAFEEALNRGTVAGSEHPFRINVPLQYLTKGEIIKTGKSMNVPYELTTSCYLGREKACGKCDSCLLRLKGFVEAGIPDPIPYETYPEFYKKFLEKN
ncbi:MAG: 7-cyano-7-deazaguanine synthase QueC [Candidatus Thermoplasmatota archaeon]|jgi:7-cyano-7-deazaguanine synthase|nr:7-cyano-7-deazaguanine synthase QueC [Candidatus Thermoplasmatota archaeon]